MAKSKCMAGRVLPVFLTAALVMGVCSGCSGSEEEQSESPVYDDMGTEYEEAGLMSSNIGIFTKTESDGAVEYGEGGSGVIIERVGDTYYALTAAHVVSSESGQLLVFTVNTDLETEEIPGFEELSTLTEETYDSMIEAETVYVSDSNDVAVISFQSDEDLSVIELAEDDPEIGDRIMCIGNPENDWFAVSYGEVTEELQDFGTIESYPTTAMKHDAYMQVGSSGGAAVGEKMTLVGITTGAGLSLDGSTFLYGTLVPVSEIRKCLENWKN